MNTTTPKTTPIDCESQTTRAANAAADAGKRRPARQFQFDPTLMEAVVTRALTAGFSGPAGFAPVEFHREADPLYTCTDSEQRAARFRELHSQWFYRGQFDRPFADALAELPDVERAVALVTVTGAASRAEERADLANAAGTPVAAGEGRVWLGISIQPARLLDRPALRRWMRHELWHVRDMLDPAFQYRREDLAAGPAERLPQRVVQDRYALLWSLSIDARVEQAGLLSMHSKEERITRFASAFPGFTPEQQRAAVDAIGVTRGLNHPELAELARSPRQIVGDESSADHTRVPLRGSACPLCHFPTFHWADLSQPAVRPIIDTIRQSYPAWSHDHGICTTCFDLFSIRSGAWV